MNRLSPKGKRHEPDEDQTPRRHCTRSMIAHVTQLTPEQRKDLLSLLTQEPVDVEDDGEVTAELRDTLRRQLSIKDTTDLAEGFRRRMVKTAEQLGGERPAGHYDFMSDREVAGELIAEVSRHAKALADLEAEDELLIEFAKTFRTMPQARRATWLRRAALAASEALEGNGDPHRAAEAAKSQDSATRTASQIARDVAPSAAAGAAAVGAVAAGGAAAAASGAAGGAMAASSVVAAGGAAAGLSALATAAGPIGLLAGGTVAYAIRRRRQREGARSAAKAKALDERGDVQVRRDRQATQAVVTVCAYLLALT